MTCLLYNPQTPAEKQDRKGKLQERICELYLKKQSQPALSHLQEPSNPRTLKDVGKSFQNKTLITYTQRTYKAIFIRHKTITLCTYLHSVAPQIFSRNWWG